MNGGSMWSQTTGQFTIEPDKVLSIGMLSIPIGPFASELAIQNGEFQWKKLISYNQEPTEFIRVHLKANALQKGKRTQKGTTCTIQVSGNGETIQSLTCSDLPIWTDPVAVIGL